MYVQCSANEPCYSDHLMAVAFFFFFSTGTRPMITEKPNWITKLQKVSHFHRAPKQICPYLCSETDKQTTFAAEAGLTHGTEAERKKNAAGKSIAWDD